MHRSGFVNIIGKPNVGKSTLMNALVGERMSIITNKPQTTRHRIIGLLSGTDFQIVFSDTPGIIDNPSYGMQRAMNRFVHDTFEDGDIMLFVVDVHEKYGDDDPIFRQLKKIKAPLFLLINKIDSTDAAKIKEVRDEMEARLEFAEVHEISALHKTGTDELLKAILNRLPEGPEYYPKDQLTDRPERFFVSEIIREKILELYHQEIPYSSEVIIESFEETQTTRGENLTRIGAIIFVSRKTQKPIIIGKDGRSIKKLGTEARKSLEEWLECKVFLEIHVKVKEDWRDDERQLKWLGYN
ncbi:MAG: GTPase Era [Saprospiraceae bacterium]|nr:GTPase Era [Saprospiraceae bacterium]